MSFVLRITAALLFLLRSLHSSFAQVNAIQGEPPIGPTSGGGDPRPANGFTADTRGASASFEGCALGAIISSNINQPGVHKVTHSRAYVVFPVQ